jgi:hypothetical protein
MAKHKARQGGTPPRGSAGSQEADIRKVNEVKRASPTCPRFLKTSPLRQRRSAPKLPQSIPRG